MSTINPNDPEDFDLQSHSIVEDKTKKLLTEFPEIATEGGRINFDQLKSILGNIIDINKERYGINWPGKADCFRTIQQRTQAALLPAKEESINFDTTNNVIVEGDNLEILKLMQKSYIGKVKLIYIDPPYNTGNDFIYPDNYSESLQTYLEYTGQVDASGKRFGTNADTDGRYHSKWLNMMYPRLYLARNLLRDDGAIFISIDDTELDNLKKICNEIFGEENFKANIIWQKRYTRSNNTVDFTTVVEYILVYSKSDLFCVNLLDRTEEADARYSNPDNDPRGNWKGASFLNPATPEQRPNLCYEIVNPNTGNSAFPTTNAWRRSKEEFNKLLADNRLYWGADGSAPIPVIKMFLSEARKLTPINFWDHEFAGNTDVGSKELKDLMDEKSFNNPKPSLLLKRILEHASFSDSLVLDFFAGSGTTAHAVLELNKQDGGNRKFILVQLPEPTDRKDYPTIADITKERVRRVIKKLNDDDAAKQPSLLEDVSPKQDRGFRVFKLAESNFKPWNADVPHDAQTLQAQLFDHVNHIRPGRTQDDILYELLLKSGFPLTTPVKTLTLEGKTVFSVAGGALLICLERALTMELIRAMAATTPERVVCLDEGFAGNDQLKANAVQIFKTKGVTKFQTV